MRDQCTCYPLAFFFALFFALPLFPAYGGEGEAKRVREPILAGTWYPGDPQALRDAVLGYLSRVKGESPSGHVTALIVPHAGYPYSGQVAAYAYHLIRNRGYRRVVLIGPSHQVAFRGVSVDQHSGYKTPLGTLPVDQELARKLVSKDRKIRYVPEAHANEHSLEIQLPFLQTVLEQFQILPVTMGEQDFETCSHLAQVLGQHLSLDEKTLILASTDLSHFHRYERAKILDTQFIERIRQLDPGGLARSLASGACEACGGGPAITAMLMAQAAGSVRPLILHYANSGDVTGDHSRVVGYLSAALLKDP